MTGVSAMRDDELREMHDRLTRLEFEIKELTSYTAYQSVKARLTALEMKLGTMARRTREAESPQKYRVDLTLVWSDVVSGYGDEQGALTATKNAVAEILEDHTGWSIVDEHVSPIIGKERPACPRCSQVVGVFQQDGEWRCCLCEIAIGAVQ